MEGLADVVLRDVLTRAGGFDLAVTEFVRVSGSLLPPRTFLRICPELARGSRTSGGTPVIVQLLGSDPPCMAENAAQLAALGPAGVDLNFGCPAPTVNRHGGGAVLLEDPALLGRIAAAVRGAMPPAIPLTAKMRLGLRDTARALDCAQALAAAGIVALIVHARTRDQGYAPPAHWDWLARIRQAVDVPVVANGEVWSVADHARCRSVSGCADVMIGRGAVADPLLASRIRAALDGRPWLREAADEWQAVGVLVAEFWRQVKLRISARQAPGRLKLWLRALGERYVEADALYRAVRTLRTNSEVDDCLRRFGLPVEATALAGGARR